MYIKFLKYVEYDRMVAGGLVHRYGYENALGSSKVWISITTLPY